MNSLRQLVANGGPVIIGIMVLSVLLYQRCFNLLLFLRSGRRQIADLSGAGAVRSADVHRKHLELTETFRQQRVAIGAMIAAAPLMGLLGTVMGMIAAFDSLSKNGGKRSMEGLAQGISEVLIATESGLAVAIPAVLFLYLAHRQLEKGIQKLVALEAAAVDPR